MDYLIEENKRLKIEISRLAMEQSEMYIQLDELLKKKMNAQKKWRYYHENKTNFTGKWYEIKKETDKAYNKNL